LSAHEFTGLRGPILGLRLIVEYSGFVLGGRTNCSEPQQKDLVFAEGILLALGHGKSSPSRRLAFQKLQQLLAPYLGSSSLD
jgi:hypothetical protein